MFRSLFGKPQDQYCTLYLREYVENNKGFVSQNIGLKETDEMGLGIIYSNNDNDLTKEEIILKIPYHLFFTLTSAELVVKNYFQNGIKHTL